MALHRPVELAALTGEVELSAETARAKGKKLGRPRGRGPRQNRPPARASQPDTRQPRKSRIWGHGDRHAAVREVMHISRSSSAAPGSASQLEKRLN